MTHVGRILVLAVLICLTTLSCATTESDPPDDPTPPVAQDSTGKLRDDAVQSAEQTAIALIALDHRDAEQDYERLLKSLTAPARQEWEQRRAAYLATLISDAVTVEGATVRASGVAALDPVAGTATILVATTAMVSSAQTPAPEERDQRLRMSLTRTAAGWEVSRLEFVT